MEAKGKFFKKYDGIIDPRTYINLERGSEGAIDIRAFNSFIEEDNGLIRLADYDDKVIPYHKVVSSQVTTDQTTYLNLGYKLVITPWEENVIMSNKKLEIPDNEKYKELRSRFKEIPSYDINSELLSRLMKDKGSAFIAKPIAFTINADGADTTREAKCKSYYGRHLYKRIVCYLFSLCSSFRQFELLIKILKLMKDGKLPITDLLLTACEVPEPTDIGEKFGKNLKESEKENIYIKSMRVKGLDTHNVSLKMLQVPFLIVQKTDAIGGNEVRNWFYNFMKEAVNVLIPEQVLVALGYMYAGKYDDKDLVKMTGTVNNLEYEVEKETLDSIIYKGHNVKDNSNIVRAYKSFISSGLYKTMLSKDIRDHGPYSFNRGLPYMFYYDSNIDIDEYTKLFIMVVESQKNIRLCASVKSLNGLLKTLKAIKPEIVEIISKMKNTTVRTYMRIRHLVNKDTPSDDGQVVADYEVDKSQKKMLSKVTVKAIGSSLKKTLKSDPKITQSLMKSFGLNN